MQNSRIKFRDTLIQEPEQWRRQGGLGGLPPRSQKSAKIVEENGIQLVAYTFRLKIMSKSPLLLSDFFRAGTATEPEV